VGGWLGFGGGEVRGCGRGRGCGSGREDVGESASFGYYSTFYVGNGVRMHIRMNIRMLIRIPRRLVISAPAEAAWR